MPYPQNNELSANAIDLNPTLQSQVFNGMTSLEAAIRAADKMSGVGDRVFLDMLIDNPVVGAGVWAREVDNAHLYCGHYRNTGVATGDNVSLTVNIPSAGTWKLTLDAHTGPNLGIFKPFLDGVQIGAAAGYDLYAAMADETNQVIVAGLALTAGTKTLRLAIDGKNGASGAFRLHLNSIVFERTA